MILMACLTRSEISAVMTRIVAIIDVRLGQIFFGGQRHRMWIVAVSASRNLPLVVGDIHMGVNLVAILRYEFSRRRGKLGKRTMTTEANVRRNLRACGNGSWSKR